MNIGSGKMRTSIVVLAHDVLIDSGRRSEFQRLEGYEAS